MISAGQDFRGVSRYGAESSRPRTKEEYDELRKKQFKKLDERLKKKIADFKKTDPYFRTCPVLVKDDKGEYYKKYGELCREAKGKLDELLSHKPEPSIEAAIRKEILREVPKEEFMTSVQNYYISRYLMNFKTKARVKRLLEKLEKDPTSKALKREYWPLYKQFMRKYTEALKAYLEKSYVMLDKKIYQIPSNRKTIKSTKATTDPDMQCFEGGNGTLEIYEDCGCPIDGGGTECEWLQEDTFKKIKDEPAKGKIRTRIYFNPSTKKLRLIPEREGFTPPEGFQPATLGALKWFLSRHKEKKDGGQKLLIDFLDLSIKGKTEVEISELVTKAIFRNEDGHYITDVDSIDFLSRFSVYNAGIHKDRVYPAGIYLNEKEAKEFITKVNNDPEILVLTRGMPPFNPTNFARSATKQSDLWEYMIPKDPALLLKLYELVDKMKKGEVATTLPEKTIKSMHGRLKHLVRADLRAEFVQQLQKWQKQFSLDSKKDQNWWQKLGFAGQLLFMVVIGVSTYFSIKLGLASLRYMRIMMLQAVDKRRADRMLKMEQNKLDEKERRNNIKKLAKKEKKGKLTMQEARTLASLRKAEQKHIEEQGMEDWEREILALSVKEGKEMKGELVDYETHLLMENPDWLIPGRDHEAWEALRARTNSGEETSPFVYGVSGSGKRYVHMAAGQKVAMAYIYENDKEELELRLRTKYQEKYDAHPEFFANDPTSVDREVDYYMGLYKEASEKLDPRLRNHRFYLIHNAKLQSGTMFRGAQADNVLQCFAANEHNATPVMQEFGTILFAGATSGGGGQDQDVSESVLELTKQHIEGSSEVGASDNSEKAEGELSNGINADTTPHRALKVQTDPRSEDLRRRFLWIANHAWSPEETLVHIHSPRIYEPIERKYNVRFSPEAREAAVRIGVHFEGKPGRIPLTSANSVMKGAADFIVKAEKSTGWDGKTPIVITEQHIFEYAESRYNVKIENRAEIGKLKMKQPREYFMFKRDVRAMKELADGVTTIMSANRASPEYVVQHIRGNEPRIVRKIAETLDLDAIGDFEGAEHDPRKGMEGARLAVLYARRLHKLGGDEIPTNTNDLQLWIEQNIDRVMPVGEDVVERAETVLQEEILRTMDPTSKKYAADTIEERHERMLEDAKTLESEVRAYANDPKGEKTLYELIQSVPTVVTAYETDQPLVPAAATEGTEPRRISAKVLARFGITENTMEHYLATNYMDADKFKGDAEIVAVARKATALLEHNPGRENLTAENIEMHAAIAIGEAMLQVRDPEDPHDPDKGPKGPKNGPKGGARGPGGAPKPDAPRPDAAPKPASDSDPTARARKAKIRAHAGLVAKIKAMLPDALKPYAEHVAAVSRRRPEILKQSVATQRAYFTVIAKKAMRRHPELIGGTREGVRFASARRRDSRRTDRDRDVDGRERRVEERRRLEHLRTLMEIRRLREMRRPRK